MHSFFRSLLQWKLQVIARWVVKSYAPKIIGVTGSVGKTSTVEAIAAVVGVNFRTRKSIKNYNNELGVPLSILGEHSAGKNLFRWWGIFFRAVRLLLVKDPGYPQVLVLEMGADKSGDIDQLLSVAPCVVGVVTAVSGVHLELFRTVERVISEKKKIVTRLPKEGIAILNADDPQVLAMRSQVRARVMTYGFSEAADVRGSDPTISEGPPGVATDGERRFGISFKIAYGGSTVPVFLPAVLGTHQVLFGLAAAAVGLGLGMNLHDISDGLRSFTPPPGRMSWLLGIKETQIIDDTYNSSPTASRAALDTLIHLPAAGRRIAALGDMAELGDATREGHEEIGMYVAHLKLDLLVTVGEKAKIIAQSAEEAGMAKEKIAVYDSAEVAGRFIQSELRPGDLILVKGSQVARMEKIVKEIMAEPLRAADVLVRQGGEWR